MKFHYSYSFFGWAFWLGTLQLTADAQSTGPVAVYVNDGTLTGDVFTSAAGSDAAGDGSASAPVATVARALALAGSATQTIFIDAGTYTEQVVLSKAVSLQGAGTATARPASATVFDGGLVPGATQTDATGLLVAVGGGTSSTPLKVAGITFQAYDFGVQADGTISQAHLVLEDVEVVHNRRQGIFWSCLRGVQDLTFRRVRAAYTAESGNTNANGAGRGMFLTNGHKADIVIEDGVFELNRRGGVDINDGSVSGLRVRNNQFTQNAGGGLIVLGAGVAGTGGGAPTGIAALIEGNSIRNNASNGMELKACTGTGRGSGGGSFVVRDNYIVRSIGAPTRLNEDNAGVAFTNRDRDAIAAGGGITGGLVTGGAFVQHNTIRGYLSDATSSGFGLNGFGLVLEGVHNVAVGNVVAQCQYGVQVQDRPTGNTTFTAFFDVSRNGLVVSAADSIRGNRLDSCATAIRTVNLTNVVEASLNWLGAATATGVRGAQGTGGQVVTLAGPAAGFAERPAFAPTGRLDYSPFLHSATDALPAAGFQPSLTYLHVDAASPQLGAAQPLTEGVATVVEGGTVGLAAGAYNERLVVRKNLTLDAEGAATLRSLGMDENAKVLTLAAPLTLTDSLTLGEGLVRTTAASLLTLGTQAVATPGNVNSFVEGPLRKLGQQAFVFPLGDNGHWARLGISAPTPATASYTAQYFATPLSAPVAAPLSEVSTVEHWTLSRDSAAGPVSVQLFWENAFRSGIDDFSTDLQVAGFDGTTWQSVGNQGLGGSLNAGSVTSLPQSSLVSAYTLGSLSPTVNPLSGQLVAFNGTQRRAGTVDLQWMLNHETTAYGYAVERWNAAGGTWQQIGFVPSAGPTGQPRTYTYQDQNAQQVALALYRLRQTTGAQLERYSPVAAVALTALLSTAHSEPALVGVFPNPTAGRVTLALPATVREAARVVLTDLSGRQVFTQALPGGAAAPEVLLPATLANGTYLLHVQAAGFVSRPQRVSVSK